MMQVNVDSPFPLIIRFGAIFFVELRARAVVIIIIISSRGPRGSVTLDDVVDGPGSGRGPLFKRGHGA